MKEIIIATCICSILITGCTAVMPKQEETTPTTQEETTATEETTITQEGYETIVGANFVPDFVNDSLEKGIDILYFQYLEKRAIEEQKEREIRESIRASEQASIEASEQASIEASEQSSIETSEKASETATIQYTYERATTYEKDRDN